MRWLSYGLVVVVVVVTLTLGPPVLADMHVGPADRTDDDEPPPPTDLTALCALLNRESIRALSVQQRDDVRFYFVERDGGARVACYTDRGALRCQPSSSPPRWMSELAALTPDALITSFEEGQGLRVVDRLEYVKVALRVDGRWRELVDRVDSVGTIPDGPWRALDATSLTGRPMLAVVTSLYEGGTQSGYLSTELLLVEVGERLTVATRKQIGELFWMADPATRARLGRRGRFHALRDRPHNEVLLEPRFGPGHLDLGVKRWKQTFRTDRDDVEAIRADVGRWRLVDGALVRQNR